LTGAGHHLVQALHRLLPHFRLLARDHHFRRFGLGGSVIRIQLRGFQKCDVGVVGRFCAQISDAQLIPRLRIARIGLLGTAEFQRRASIVLLIEIFLPLARNRLFSKPDPGCKRKKALQ
jgi:hypothetical protein